MATQKVLESNVERKIEPTIEVTDIEEVEDMSNDNDLDNVNEEESEEESDIGSEEESDLEWSGSEEDEEMEYEDVPSRPKGKQLCCDIHFEEEHAMLREKRGKELSCMDEMKAKNFKSVEEDVKPHRETAVRRQEPTFVHSFLKSIGHTDAEIDKILKDSDY